MILPHFKKNLLMKKCLNFWKLERWGGGEGTGEEGGVEGREEFGISPYLGRIKSFGLLTTSTSH